MKYFDSLLDDEVKILIKLVRACASDIRSPRALTYELLLSSYEEASEEVKCDIVRQIMSIDAHPYRECMQANIILCPTAIARRYKDDAQLAGLCKKAIGWPGVSDEERDWNTWSLLLETEQRNRETNQRFINDGTLLPELPEIMFYIKKEVARILGEPPSKGTLADYCDFGPGATYSLSKHDSNLFNKLTSLDCTEESSEYICDLLQVCYPGWDLFEGSAPLITKGNRYFSVPKKYTINRDCRCEPTLNGFLQKGLGGYIRNRAQRKAGLLLDTAQDHHRSLAQSGSLNGLIATEDGKSASNLISTSFVFEVLAPEWFDLLDMSRSKKMQVTAPISGDHYWLNQELFSSMGNGFTFELETVLFYSVAKAVCSYLDIHTHRHNLSTFGDDVILPCEASELYRKVSQRLGFLPNMEKSFNTGFFRESCGGDYFHGLNVRPQNIEGNISTQTLFVLHNQLQRSGNRYDYPTLFRTLIEIIKTTGYGHLKGPDDGSDGHLVVLRYPRHMPFKAVSFVPHFFSPDPKVDKDISRCKNQLRAALKAAPSEVIRKDILRNHRQTIRDIKERPYRTSMYRSLMYYSLYRQWKGERSQIGTQPISLGLSYKATDDPYKITEASACWAFDPSQMCATLPFKGVVKTGTGSYKVQRRVLL